MTKLAEKAGAALKAWLLENDATYQLAIDDGGVWVVLDGNFDTEAMAQVVIEACAETT